ncbi:hypothetical protein HBH64_179120 [Parastagonospora nodorum]|nr:hypothetical protein HBI01_177150 [Parastagonospora nodorum]KAH4293710.1 hypothetical protein HBI02_183150 [Parastagonospora nodorum]KAH4324250.1 hypothetical protein HBI00_171620 [Parastagonospora nodorum]KAH4364972.1 hypothetical protein HBH94_159370 [Parastagonospora nodorum]KAH4457218.1 hypothetical protein HBH90_162900 [Parastagonospora nodorum]
MPNLVHFYSWEIVAIVPHVVCPIDHATQESDACQVHLQSIKASCHFDDLHRDLPLTTPQIICRHTIPSPTSHAEHVRVSLCIPHLPTTSIVPLFQKHICTQYQNCLKSLSAIVPSPPSSFTQCLMLLKFKFTRTTKIAISTHDTTRHAASPQNDAPVCYSNRQLHILKAVVSLARVYIMVGFRPPTTRFPQLFCARVDKACTHHSHPPFQPSAEKKKKDSAPQHTSARQGGGTRRNDDDNDNDNDDPMTCLALKPPSVPTEGSKLWARSTSRINPSHHLGYLKILHLPLLCKLLPFSSLLPRSAFYLVILLPSRRYRVVCLPSLPLARRKISYARMTCEHHMRPVPANSIRGRPAHSSRKVGVR